SGSVPLVTVFETSRRLITSGVALQDGTEDLPDVVGHDSRAFGRRVNAVALIERLIARDPGQEKRHQRDVVAPRERRIDLMKPDRVVAPEVRRRLHARQDDRDPAMLPAL